MTKVIVSKTWYFQIGMYQMCFHYLPNTCTWGIWWAEWLFPLWGYVMMKGDSNAYKWTGSISEITSVEGGNRTGYRQLGVPESWVTELNRLVQVSYLEKVVISWRDWLNYLTSGKEHRRQNSQGRQKWDQHRKSRVKIKGWSQLMGGAAQWRRF